MIPHKREHPPVGSGFCDGCDLYTIGLLSIGGRSKCESCTVQAIILRWLGDRAAGPAEGWVRRRDLILAMSEAGWRWGFRDLRPDLEALEQRGLIEQKRVIDTRGSLLFFRAVRAGVAP